MSSSSERVRPDKTYTPRFVRLLLNDLSKIKRQSLKGTVDSPQQTEKPFLDTEDQSPMVVKEFENEILCKEKNDIEREVFNPPIDVERGYYGEGHPSQLQLQNSDLAPRQKRTACSEPVTLEDGDYTPKLPRPGLEPGFLDKLQTPMYTNDLDLSEPDPTPSSSSSVVTYPLLPSEVPSSVTLTFESSDEEDDSSQSRDPMPSTSGTTSLPHRTKLISGAHLTSETTVDSALSSSIGSVENYASMSLHSELCLPVDNEQLKTEEDISSLGPHGDTNILYNEPNFIALPVFIKGSQDAMFLEEVSMTIRQFNELLENLFLYQCFQVPGTESRLKLEAVLKFLVRGESIANLAQEYKIAKNTFTKYLPEVLDAIFKMLGLLRVKKGEKQFTEIQKRFTERLGLPNCCGVLYAKTIITWRPSAPTCLPVITLTDADYSFLYLDMEATIEEQGIDFRSTRMYGVIHTVMTSALILPKLGFVVGSHELPPTGFVSPLYTRADVDMPIPHLYNSRVEKALRISENAYGILTSKFKIYDKIMTLTPNVAKAVVKATCALHNWLKQVSPGYLSPGLVDVETDGQLTLGSWRFAPRQIFQPIRFFQPHGNSGWKARYDRKRDIYAFNLYNLEQTKNSQHTT